MWFCEDTCLLRPIVQVYSPSAFGLTARCIPDGALVLLTRRKAACDTNLMQVRGLGFAPSPHDPGPCGSENCGDVPAAVSCHLNLERCHELAPNGDKAPGRSFLIQEAEVATVILKIRLSEIPGKALVTWKVRSSKHRSKRSHAIDTWSVVPSRTSLLRTTTHCFLSEFGFCLVLRSERNELPGGCDDRYVSV